MARLCRRPITSSMSLCNLREEDALLDSDPPIVLFRRELAFTFVQVTGLLVLESLYSLNSSSASPPSVSPLLVSSGLEAETTEVAGGYINQGLQEYNNNKTKEDSWKSKNTAVYLLTAVATRGSTTQVFIKGN